MVKKVAKFDAYSDYRIRIKQLTIENRFGTAKSYQCALRSIETFTGQKKLFYDDITINFLKEYETFMTGKGNSQATIGIYLRTLRFFFNEAIGCGRLDPVIYPFGKGKYVIPNPGNVKKALSTDEIKKLYNCSALLGKNEQFYKALWFFSYLCNGMNIKDICLLKYGNLSSEYLTFKRAKTVTTSRNTRMIELILCDDAKSIVETWGNHCKSKDEYIFPILTQEMIPIEQHNKIQSIIRCINRTMKRIAGRIGIEKSVTTYAARHSFATILKRKGVSISYISEAMGHSNVQVTESYLDGFDDGTKRANGKKLVVWK